MTTAPQSATPDRPDATSAAPGGKETPSPAADPKGSEPKEARLDAKSAPDNLGAILREKQAAESAKPKAGNALPELLARPEDLYREVLARHRSDQVGDRQRTDDDLPSRREAARVINNYYVTTHVGTATGQLAFGPSSSIQGGERRADSVQADAGRNRASGGSWLRSAFLACQHKPDDLAFLLAVAALEGLAFSDIRTASAQLADTLRPLMAVPAATDDKERPPPPPILLSTLEDQFEVFGVEVLTEKSPAGRMREVVKFREPGAAVHVMHYALTRLSFGSNWPNPVISWIELLGAGAVSNYEVRLAAGRAAGLLWVAGHKDIEQRVVAAWFTADSTKPLTAFDACFAIAARESEQLREETKRRVLHWGHFGGGVDGLFALRRLVVGSYWTLEPKTCAKALSHLITIPGLVAFVHALETFTSLFKDTIDRPEDASCLLESLLGALLDAQGRDAEQRRQQVILGLLSLLEVEAKIGDGKRVFVIDRLLGQLSATSELAQLLNLALAPSPIQPTVVGSIQDLTLRNLKQATAAAWRETPVLVVLDRMFETGTAQDRKRLAHYVEQWSNASQHKRDAGAHLAADLRGEWAKRGY